MKPDKYYGAAIAAFFIWGFIPFPLRALAGYPSGQILYFRILVSVLCLLALVFTLKRKALKQLWQTYQRSTLKEKRRLIGFTAGGGLLLTFNWLLYIFVVNHVSIQTASFAYLICPILTALLGFLLLKETLRINQWIAIGFTLLSCAFLGIGSVTSLALSLLIAASYAFYLISQRLLKDYDKIVLLTFQLALAFVVIGPFYPYFQAGGALLPDLRFFGFIAILSAGFTVLPLFLNLFALKKLNSGTIGILMYLNPIINFALAFLYFREAASWAQAVAYLVIFLSVILYNIRFGKPLLAVAATPEKH